MAFDGIVVSGIVSEIKKRLVGGRIYKIYQPEIDEICLVVKNRLDDQNITERLLLSADASLPLMYLTKDVKENPQIAPNFCMLLRKHIGNGRILDIRQPNFERIVEITIEHLDEMGDLCHKKLIMEIMGKHSNLIFTDVEGRIIDSIKHVSFQMSSVREVLPGRKYEYPPMQDKKNPLEIDINYWVNHVMSKPLSVAKAIYTSLTGISPVVANEIAYRGRVDGGISTAALTLPEKERLFESFQAIFDDVKAGVYTPCIAYAGYEPREFSTVLLSSYGDVFADGFVMSKEAKGLLQFDSCSEVVETYYRSKSIVTRMKQRGSDLRRIVASAIERTSKKYDLQLAQLDDTKNREIYRVYGELITAYGYNLQPGDKELVCENYYDGNNITIPIDPTIPVMENGKRYFAKYNKLKRTFSALTELSEHSKTELDYLLSVQTSLSFATSEYDLQQIKDELIESGYIRGKSGAKKGGKPEKSKPLHYISSDGYHMYVGKNNYQNEVLTFQLAGGNDIWFHAKQIPGSHVIVKLEGAKELPDRTYEEAARLAAFYSSGKQAPKVEIDYTARKNLKKPPKARPGFVIYHTNYSMTIEPDIHGIEEVK
ncbi:MAG: NFACT RNA binding domain-containing protein [Eubacteriales bacterium]|nr:NFACT RNA binding domain-containing protein [Lachnospiraceae bacterium]MDO5127629.1 NFACT RNA binding domain-containing protein [Eubacteriales bacterium]